MTRGVWHSWTEKEVLLVKTLKSLPELIKKRNACQDLLNQIFPSTTSKIRDIPISGKGENTAEHKVHEILDIRAQMSGDIARQDKEIARIMGLLDPLEPDEHTVLNKMYFQGMFVFKIAQDMNYSERMIYKLRRSGLNKIEKSVQVCANTLIYNDSI